MRFVVSSSQLSARLQTIGRVIVSKNSLPILDSFLFQIRDGKLSLTASDNETSITTWMDLVECECDITFAVNAKTIQDAMKEIPEQPLEFYVNNDNLEITVVYKNGRYNFMAQVADEYPQAPALPEECGTLSLASQTLYQGINRTLFATADDTLRPVMNGICFDMTANSLTIVASDGRKLACDTLANAQISQAGTFILQKKPAALVKNILAKDHGDVTIRYSERNAVITSELYSLNCRLIEGRYPNYNSVIPQDNPYQVTVNREAFQSALRRVQIFTTASTSLVKIKLEASKMTISTQDIDFSMSAEEVLLCDYSEMPMSIGFPGSSLMEVLSNMDGEDIIIKLSDPSRAGVLYPVEQSENENVLMLLMPMMLND